MRKDLKIGLAIGAVLLVLLIVFFAMPKPDGTEVAGSDPAGESAEAANLEAEPTDPAPPQDDELAPEPAPAPPVADAPRPSDPVAPGAERSDAGAGAEVADAGESGGGTNTNWPHLLASGGDPAPVTSVTPGVSGRGGAGTADPEALARGDAAADGPADGATEREAFATPPAPADSASTVRIPTEQETGAGRTHVVKEGETYTSIAKQLYGHGRHYLAIQEANPDLDPERIRPGTVINLPDRDSIRAATPESAGGASASAARRQIDPKTEHEVKRGDSLHRIAAKWYGSPAMADEIYELNEETIGPDPAKLRPGTVLKMPPNPNSSDAGAGSSGSASR